VVSRSQTTVRKNIVANMLGSGWTAILAIAFVPLYIHFMGVEAYGLVGFYVTLQMLFSVLDLGLTATLTRELARLSALGNAGSLEMRNVVRTLELIYWSLAALIILLVVAASGWISTSWLNGRQLSPDVIRSAVILMGIVIAFRMPYSFYTGGLIGLQKQVLLNGVKIAIETFRNGGGVVVLWLVSPTITAFFAWHAIAGVIGAGVLCVVLWRKLPAANDAPKFTPALFRKLWRFGAGMSGIAVISLLVMEMDKVVLSKMLPLDELGYYMLASTLAMGLSLLSTPIFSAILPRLTQLVASKDDAGVREIYHSGSQFMTALIMPVALTLSLYSEPVLQIWTQSETVAQHSSPILSLLVVGTAFNAMMYIPYALQLAHAWTRLTIIANVIYAAVLFPALIWMISKYGVLGAASIWVMLNVASVLFSLPIIHAKFLKGELKRWVLVDFALPTLAVLAVVGLLAVAMPADMGMVGNLFWICISLLISLLSSFLLTPVTRAFIFRFMFAK